MGIKKAIFAGGCFWGVEEIFSGILGVISVQSGYTGGHTSNPAYKDVCSDGTGHAEAVLVEYDAGVTDYAALVRIFFELHDPTQMNRQGPDYGSQYRSAIFYFDENQRADAQDAMDYLKSHGVDAVTELIPAGVFYPAEEYHQKYFKKNPDKAHATCHFRREINWDAEA